MCLAHVVTHQPGYLEYGEREPWEGNYTQETTGDRTLHFLCTRMISSIPGVAPHFPFPCTIHEDRRARWQIWFIWMPRCFTTWIEASSQGTESGVSGGKETWGFNTQQGVWRLQIESVVWRFQQARRKKRHEEVSGLPSGLWIAGSGLTLDDTVQVDTHHKPTRFNKRLCNRFNIVFAWLYCVIWCTKSDWTTE